MPETKDAPRLDHVDLEQAPLVLGFEELEREYALSLVLKTFSIYEQFRTQNHDHRWNLHDSLYFGWLPPKVWEGTNVPRSNLGIPVVFDQVESAFPVIVQSLFGDREWFQVEPAIGGDPQAARAVQGWLAYVLEDDREELGLSARLELMLAIKSVLLYGNGGVFIEWDSRRDQPVVQWVDIRDVYIDPQTPTPSIDTARSVIRRKMMTVDELAALRKHPDMRIPEDAVLYGMARSFPLSQADTTKRVQEALRGVLYNPGPQANTALPADKFVEVLIYYSKDRIIWVLNREWVAYNKKNPYGFIPACFAPCYNVISRFYAMGMADVQEGNQRTMEALLNARLDEVNLSLHPPRIQKRNVILTPSQQRWRPGAQFLVSDPKDIAVIQPAGATSNVFQELQFLENLAFRRTGINPLMAGTPMPSNANRTLGGMQAQLQGSSSRLQPVVAHIEQYLIIPMLYKVYSMARMHKMPDEMLPALINGEYTEVPAAALFSPVRFKMLASSRMITRDRLIQVVPMLIQFLVQGPLLAQLNRVGKTVDFEELMQLIQDATGVSRRYRLIRPMTPEEFQATQTPPPEVAVKQQQAQLQAQTRLQAAQIKAQTELQKAAMENQPKPEDQAKAQAEALRQQARLAAERMMQALRLQAERAKTEGRLRAEERKMQLDEMKHQAELRRTLEKLFMQQMAQEAVPPEVPPEEVAE